MALVNEHQIDLSPKPDAPQPEQSMVKVVNELLGRSRRATQDMRSEWGQNYRFFNGQQWAITRPAWRFSEVVNLTWSSIMQEVGIQTDSRPKTDYIGVEPSDIDFADILSEINDLNWAKYNWNQNLAGKILDSKIVHVTHTEVCWNPELENGLGDIEHKDLDPFYCYWDPKATDVSDARWFVYIQPTSTGELKKKYPDKEIKEDITYPLDSGSTGYKVATDVDKLRLGYGQTLNYRARDYRDLDQFGGEPTTLLVRCWMKDETIEEIAEEKDLGNGEIKTEYIQKLKYPGGRYIEIAGNTLLRDGPNGIWINGECVPYEHGKFPIVRLVNYSYGREYAGENEITHLRSPQRITNYVWSFILDVMKRGSAPQKIIGSGASVDVDNLTDEPGLNIECADVNQIRYEYGPGVPASLFNVLEHALGMTDRVQGLQDVSRGAQQPGVTSGLMMEGFVEASQTRPRLKNRSVEAYLQSLGQLDAAIYLQFYTAPRVFRITNKEGYPEYAQFWVQGEGENRQINVEKAKKLPTGEWQQTPRQTLQAKGIPDVKVTTGSALPYAKAQKTATAQMLFQAGAIDQEEFLKAVDWPNAEAVLSRMAQTNVMQPPGAPAGAPIGQKGLM